MNAYEIEVKLTRLYHLDLLRGGAAFLVLAGHLRAFVFQGYGELAYANVPIKAFYFATGLGHQAVVIFFALSGFLVGGKALDDILNWRFSWSYYLLRRLTRLWIVIVPALLMTMVLDSIGSWLTLGSGYDGRYFEMYFSGPSAPAGADHSLTAFLGNLAFLQTIWVPAFGSNGPMWSLANEFWYYVIFPLAVWLALSKRIDLVKIIGLVIFIAAVISLPFWLLASGLIWVAGAAAAWCTRRQVLVGILVNSATRVSAVAILFGALALSKTAGDEIGDLELGIVVALILPVFARIPSPKGMYQTLARSVSEVSYTLYLTHFPFLACIVLTMVAPIRFAPSIAGAGIYVALMCGAIFWAIGFWWCFERNTDNVYSWIAGRLLAPNGGKSKRSEKLSI
jgi:peptidoglycan/LPS O-acetylase OafA/YrhL